MVNYKAGDFLIQVKNAAMAGKKELTLPATKYIVAVAETLKRENMLDSVELTDGKITARLRFHKKSPILMNIKLISKPGLRIYSDRDELAKRKGASWLVLSTSKGVLSSKEAIKQGVGGEVIAEVW